MSMAKQIEIRLGEGDRVSAHWGPHTLATDQDGSAPSPFDLFLASVGACTGFYVLRFCRERRIDTAGLRIVEHVRADSETHRVGRIEIELLLPPGFPERYRDALIRAASLCTVKRHLERPPEVAVTAVTAVESAR